MLVAAWAMACLTLPSAAGLGGQAVAASAPSGGPPGTAAAQTGVGGVSLTLQDAEVREVLASLADAAGWNFVALPGLQGRVGVSLRGLSVEQAVDLVARIAGVGYVLQDRTLVVGPRDALESRFGAQNVRPARPGQPPGVPQVAIEAMVVELFFSESQAEPLASSLVPIGLAAGSGVAQLTPSEALAQLQALERRGLARLLARPRLTAVSGQAATIFLGDQTPVVLQGVSENVTFQRLEQISVGIRLQVTPTVLEDGSIVVQVQTEVSNAVEFVRVQGNELPRVRTRSASTRVRVRDGEAIFIGGLTREAESENQSGVPILREFPVFGQLFTTQRVEQERTDLTILLFPTLVTQAAQAAPAPQQTDPLVQSLPGGMPLRPRRQLPSGPRSALRLTATDALSSAWQLSLERAVRPGRWAATTVTVVPSRVQGQDGHAVGLGLEWRWTWPAVAPHLWVGAGADNFWLQDPQAATTGQAWMARLDAGARVPIPDTPLFLEPYARWVPVLSSTDPTRQFVRWERGLWAGLNVGVSF